VRARLDDDGVATGEPLVHEHTVLAAAERGGCRKLGCAVDSAWRVRFALTGRVSGRGATLEEDRSVVSLLVAATAAGAVGIALSL
jgi:hypothetical protein